MKTLYDLLGALPDDDADELRAAFRKAAKANHPDFNPGNPEASERFRKIVRANAILSDGQQRAAYDRLLVVAHRQQDRKPKRATFFGAARRLAADAIARLVCHRWPGNVRELQNVVAGLVVLAPTRGRVGARHVDQVLAASGSRPLAASCSLACARTDAERRAVAAALARHGGRRAAAARELGITRQGLAKAVRRLRLGAAVGAAEEVA